MSNGKNANVKISKIPNVNANISKPMSNTKVSKGPMSNIKISKKTNAKCQDWVLRPLFMNGLSDTI